LWTSHALALSLGEVTEGGQISEAGKDLGGGLENETDSGWSLLLLLVKKEALFHDDDEEIPFCWRCWCLEGAKAATVARKGAAAKMCLWRCIFDSATGLLDNLSRYPDLAMDKIRLCTVEKQLAKPPTTIFRTQMISICLVEGTTDDFHN